jgi:glycosyltransferase involved in cell wall biosynthesis
MRVVNIGFYPPPYGGISIHLKRLRTYINKTGFINEWIDFSRTKTDEKKKLGIKVISWKKTIASLLLGQRSIVHFHDFSWKNMLGYYLLKFRHKTVLSFHNERFLFEIEKAPDFLKRIVIKAINSMDCIIVDSIKCFKLAERIIGDIKKIKIIPEYIPPLEIPVLSDEHEFMQLRRKYKYLLSSNASRFNFYKGEDVYGVDMLIELLARLVKDGIDTAMIFLLPQQDNNEYFNKLKSRIRSLELNDRFIFITEPVEEASSLWEVSDLFIRPTNTDGNSVSVMEALSVNTPVLASDCVPRPDSAILFKTRSTGDLYEQTKWILENLNDAKSKSESNVPVNSAEKIIHIYRELGGSKDAKNR